MSLKYLQCLIFLSVFFISDLAFSFSASSNDGYWDKISFDDVDLKADRKRAIEIGFSMSQNTTWLSTSNGSEQFEGSNISGEQFHVALNSINFNDQRMYLGYQSNINTRTVTASVSSFVFNRQSIDIGTQQRFAISPWIDPWIGVAIRYTWGEIREQYTVNDNAFINNIPDKKVSALGISFMIEQNYVIYGPVKTGLFLRYEKSLTRENIADLSTLEVGITLSYKLGRNYE